jgi:hypothetical protein
MDPIVMKADHDLNQDIDIFFVQTLNKCVEIIERPVRYGLPQNDRLVMRIKPEDRGRVAQFLNSL